MSDQPAKTHVPSVIQLIVSLAGLVITLLSVLVIWLLMQSSGSMQSLPDPTTQQIPSLLWVGLIIAIVTVPSTILSIRRLSRKTNADAPPKNLFAIASVAFAFFIPLVFMIFKNLEILHIPFIAGILSMLVVVIPLWWFVEFGQRGLIVGSPQRLWGLINFEVYIVMPLIIVTELLLILIAFVVGSVWFVQQTEVNSVFTLLQTQVLLDPQETSNVLEQMNLVFQKPDVLVAIFVLAVILIPLIEEILKPLALWFFIKRDWSPSAGFSAGLICGAAFALVESVMSVVAASQETWLATLIGRVGTGLLHTLTTGLTGWALVSSWRDRKYLRIGLIYLASVSIHGLWNFFALLFGLGSVLELNASSSSNGIVTIAPWFLGILFIGMMAILFLMNRKIKISMIPPAIPISPVETIG